MTNLTSPRKHLPAFHKLRTKAFVWIVKKCIEKSRKHFKFRNKPDFCLELFKLTAILPDFWLYRYGAIKKDDIGRTGMSTVLAEHLIRFQKCAILYRRWRCSLGSMSEMWFLTPSYNSSYHNNEYCPKSKPWIYDRACRSTWWQHQLCFLMVPVWLNHTPTGLPKK